MKKACMMRAAARCHERIGGHGSRWMATRAPVRGCISRKTVDPGNARRWPGRAAAGRPRAEQRMGTRGVWAVNGFMRSGSMSEKCMVHSEQASCRFDVVTAGRMRNELHIAGPTFAGSGQTIVVPAGACAGRAAQQALCVAQVVRDAGAECCTPPHGFDASPYASVFPRLAWILYELREAGRRKNDAERLAIGERGTGGQRG
ncbi:hypothetical protein [Burkholderia anthina]|uniref:Uncharacterized protein n=1 Tax=Burkholderia anthina TaxID=179879 RepID=A0ABS2BA76_9BURK|nr:hypothetical protein [Burkholderia anthina]MBM2769271.1 hypothetical protein [Burkholderia anthina]